MLTRAHGTPETQREEDMFKKMLLASLITAFSLVAMQGCGGGEEPKAPAAEEKKENGGGLTDRMRDRGEEPAAPAEGAAPAQQ